MATVRDLVTAAAREIGVLAAGETMSADDASLCLDTLNRWVDSQSLDRLQIFTTTRTTFDVVANTAEYSIGGNLDTAVEDGFDTGWTGAPDDWTANTTGDGAITNDTTTYQAGGHAVRMDVTATGTASIHQDFLVRSGEEVTLSIYARATFTSAGMVRVQNLDTGNYLTSAGAWQAAVADVFEADAGSVWVLETLTFTIEDSATVGSSISTVRLLLCQNDVTATVRFDTLAFTGSTSIPIPRPVFIDHVNLIDTSQDPDAETPLGMLTEDGWASVTDKAQTSTIPTHWYYNPTYPLGLLTLWPVPTGTTYQLAIYAPQQVEAFSTIDDTVSLPPGYERMIVKNLALELCPAFERTPSPLLVQQAAQAMGAVKRVNRRISELDVSAGFGGRGGQYDIRTDQ